MAERNKQWLKAAGLTLPPVIVIFPVLAVARFGPAGPVSVWPALLYAPVAMWMQTRALGLLLHLFRHGGDPATLAILPLRVVSLCTYLLSAAILVLSLPSMLSKLP